MLSTTDRLNRSGWWAVQVVSVIVGLLSQTLLPSAPSPSTQPIHSITLIAFAGLLIAAEALRVIASVRRFHDRNKSGWYLLPLLIAMYFPVYLAYKINSGEPLAISVIAFLWYIIELGALSGTHGPNQYGPKALSLFERPDETFGASTTYSGSSIEPHSDGRHKSFSDIQHERKKREREQRQSEFEGYASKNARRTNSALQNSPSLPKPVASGNHPIEDAWRTAITYFPDIKNIYEQLQNVAPEHAEQFKSDRLRLKDFSSAQQEYWRLLNRITEETCGNGNAASRSFLLSAINNGDYDNARRFIALAKVLGAENMNDEVLARFKASNKEFPLHTNSQHEKEWYEATNYHPEARAHFETLRQVSPKHAEAFKDKLLASRAFSGASNVFEEQVYAIVNEHCRGANWQPRDYLRDAIMRGKYDVARGFMAIAKKVGAENVDNKVLDKFKRSLNRDWDRDDG